MESSASNTPKKIKLDRGDLIVFLGSMNAMPMMYAWDLKSRGYNVLYFVDAPRKDALSRPENHYPEISYPYPEWIIELKIKTQIFIPFFPWIFSKYIVRKVRKISKNKISCFVLNGFFMALSPYLKSIGEAVALSHGTDLDVWANKEEAINLSASFSNRSIFKFIPKKISSILIGNAVFAQYAGLASSDYVVYFPEGLNEWGDRVIKSLDEYRQIILRRYDVSFEVMGGIERGFKKRGRKLIVLSAVRFIYQTFPDGNRQYSKGNDIIIRGLAKYFQRNKNIEVHFVEKGEDVGRAKNLCDLLQLKDIVIWHKEMPFKKLIELYVQSDVCFDQVGLHWMGAIGAYALFLGKPLIANVENLVSHGVFPEDHPILSAGNEDEVFNALVKLEDESYREEISISSKKFVEKEMGCGKIINQLFDLM